MGSVVWTQQFQSTAYYNQGDQLTSLINQPVSGSSSGTSGFHYTYDPAGNIASKQVETSASDTTISTYNHNTLNQISSSGGTDGVKPITVRGSTNESATVKLKPNLANHWKDARMLSGNRFEAEIGLTTGSNQIHIQAKDGSNNVSNYTYTLNLTASPAASPTYDADGNMTSDGVRSYEWDIQSRLMKITWDAGSNNTTEYRYNALGQRSEQIEKTGTTETAHYYYLYDGIQRITRFNGGNETSNIDRQYLSQGEQRKNGNNWDSYYYNRDHLGSIREVMNSDGTLAARYDYDSYGKRSTQYQSSNYQDGCDLAYTGHYIQQSPVAGQTELELTFYRAYDPELGRWLSADPLGESGGMNLYGYVGGDSLNKIDRLGLQTSTLNPDLAVLLGEEAAATAADLAASERATAISERIAQALRAARAACTAIRLAEKIKRVSNPKHHKNSNSPEPDNVEELYEKSVMDKNGVSWSKDANGTINRFSKPSNGECHWNGSTSGSDPIKLNDIPNEILKLFK